MYPRKTFPKYALKLVPGFLTLFDESGCKLVKKLHGMLQSGTHRINIQVLMSAVVCMKYNMTTVFWMKNFAQIVMNMNNVF